MFLLIHVVSALAAVSSAQITYGIDKPSCSSSYCQENTRCWTDWMDCDNPTGTGDWETISNLRKCRPMDMCPNPTAIEVENVDGFSLAEAGNVFNVSDHITGFICKNEDQESCPCRDYRVRFICNPPYCGHGRLCTSRFYDRDDPSGTGDWETLEDLRKAHPEIDARPVSIEAFTVDTDTPAIMTGQDFLHYSPTIGFVCKNGPNQICRDYKVRFQWHCRPTGGRW